MYKLPNVIVYPSRDNMGTS